MGSNVIRAARPPEDATQLCCLNRAFNGDDTASPEHIARMLQNPGIEHCLLCERDGQIVGFICGICFSSLCYRAPVAQITELYVDPAFRRSGVATALVQAMTDLFRSLGATEILLLTGEDNRDAQSVYERCGFEKQNERCYQQFFE